MKLLVCVLLVGMLSKVWYDFGRLSMAGAVAAAEAHAYLQTQALDDLLRGSRIVCTKYTPAAGCTYEFRAAKKGQKK